MFRLGFALLLGLLPVLTACTKAQAATEAEVPEPFVQGEKWLDTDGNPINAHGAGMLYHDGVYYLYGEYKVGETVLPEWATWECYRTDVTGVSCYSSKDLRNWKFEGLALEASKDPEHDLHASKVLERPKVVYNARTGKFVMWAHVESADYSKAAAGVAVADSPTGPFTYLGSFRPNDAMSRDQTVFVDDDGKAYQFASSENNATMYINELSDDYLTPTGNYTRIFIGASREAGLITVLQRLVLLLCESAAQPLTLSLQVVPVCMRALTLLVGKGAWSGVAGCVSILHRAILPSGCGAAV